MHLGHCFNGNYHNGINTSRRTIENLHFFLTECVTIENNKICYNIEAMLAGNTLAPQ